MPTFRFTTAGPLAGQSPARRIEAASRDEAVAQLAAEGIDVVAGDLVEESLAGSRAPVAAGSLSAEQSRGLAEGLAGLTAARLPLESGLEALADEFTRGGSRRAIYAVAARLRSGEPLSTAAGGLPPLLRSLLTPSVAGGRFLDVLPEVAAIEARRVELRRRLRVALLYPSLLLGFLYLLLMLLCLLVGPNFARVFQDFGMLLPLDTRIAIAVFSPTGALVISGLVAVVVVCLFGLEAASARAFAAQGFVYSIPLLGPVLYSSHWSEWLRLLGLLVRLRTPLPEALRRIAVAHRSIVVSSASARMASRIEAGISLAAAMDEVPSVPSRLRPLVEKVDDPETLADTLAAAAEAFEAQSRQRSGLVSTVILPFFVVGLLCTIGMVVTAFMMPLISLIQKLS